MEDRDNQTVWHYCRKKSPRNHLNIYIYINSIVHYSSVRGILY